MEYKISLLQDPRSVDIVAVSTLLRQHIPEMSDITLDDISDLLQRPDTFLFFVSDRYNKVIGAVTLVSNIKLGKRRQTWIEDLIVDVNCRGQGIGEALVKTAIQKAKFIGATSIALTSRPCRIAANALYQKLGFEIVETNYYKLDLSH